MIQGTVFFAALLTALPSPAAADTEIIGLELTEQAVAPPVAIDPFGLGYDTFGALATFANGDVLVFDGRQVSRLDAEGELLESLADLGLATFPSFVKIAPDESHAVFAESSLDGVYRIELTGDPGWAPLTTLPFAFDAVYESATTMIVSAAPCGFGCGSQLLRLDTTTGAQTVVAEVDGPSGPVAMDDSGNLWYATIDLEGPTDVLFWPAGLLTGSPAVDEDDAILYSSGFDGASSLAHDPVYGWLYLAENSFASNVHRVVRVAGTANSSKTLVEGGVNSWFSQLELRNEPGPAVFFEFQPSEGGSLRYSDIDYFSSTSARRELRPQRPVVGMFGPGTTGSGQVTFQLSNGWPNGAYVLMYCAKNLYASNETLFFLEGSPPLFTGLHFPTGGLVSGLFPLSPGGSSQFTFDNASGLTDFLAVQALVLAGNGDVISASLPAFL